MLSYLPVIESFSVINISSSHMFNPPQCLCVHRLGRVALMPRLWHPISFVFQLESQDHDWTEAQSLYWLITETVFSEVQNSAHTFFIVQMLPSFIHLGHYELLCTSRYYTFFLAMNGCKHFLCFLLNLLDNNKETVHVSLEKCRKAHLVLLVSKKVKITKKIRGSAVNCFNWAIQGVQNY